MAQLRKALEPIRDLVWRRANRITSMIPPPPYGGLPGVQKKVFIVCANPIGSASFSHAIADSAARGLSTAGHEVRRINLYDMPAEVSGSSGIRGFAPLLSAEEREGYFLENNQPQLRSDPHVQYAGYPPLNNAKRPRSGGLVP